jgi:hypothetical protein
VAPSAKIRPVVPVNSITCFALAEWEEPRPNDLIGGLPFPAGICGWIFVWLVQRFGGGVGV